MFSRFTRIFFQGLIALLPIIITLYLIFVLAWWAEETMRGILTLAIPDPDPATLQEGQRLPAFRYYPGMGLVLAVILIFLFGLLLNAYLVKRFYAYAETVMQRIPVIKSVYGATKDFLGYFSSVRRQEMSKVVLVTLPGSQTKLLGLITRESFEDLPNTIGSKDHVAVYLPMSYQIGGYTMILPRDQVEAVNMSIEDCLRFVLTAGIREKHDPASVLGAMGTVPLPPEPEPRRRRTRR